MAHHCLVQIVCHWDIVVILSCFLTMLEPDVWFRVLLVFCGVFASLFLAGLRT